VAVALVVTLAASVRAEPADPSAPSAAVHQRPRGAVENCRGISGFGESLRDFTRRRNLVVGPLAILRAGRTLAYVRSDAGIGNKLFVVVRSGHRVTLELSRRTRQGAGLGFGFGPNQGDVRLRDTRRVVTFVACRRGEYPWAGPPDGWPVSGWVGFLLARSPRCVPLLVWVDDEPSPRRRVIRFGVRRCD
jgi:hypothetical protein